MKTRVYSRGGLEIKKFMEVAEAIFADTGQNQLEMVLNRCVC